jgi:hypothetical protein
VFPSTGTDAYLFATERLSDGAMLAWKTIVLRNSTSEAICGGGSGDAAGGMMGPPDGAGFPPSDGAPPPFGDE